jgi:hypothetical protein
MHQVSNAIFVALRMHQASNSSCFTLIGCSKRLMPESLHLLVLRIHDLLLRCLCGTCRIRYVLHVCMRRGSNKSCVALLCALCVWLTYHTGALNANTGTRKLSMLAFCSKRRIHCCKKERPPNVMQYPLPDCHAQVEFKINLWRRDPRHRIRNPLLVCSSQF